MSYANVFVVAHPRGVEVFADSGAAVAHAEKVGVDTVYERPVRGAPPAPERAKVRLVGYDADDWQTPKPAAPPPPGFVLGPDGKYVSEEGSELVRQPHLPLPENRRVPPQLVPQDLPRLRRCAYCPTVLPPDWQSEACLVCSQQISGLRAYKNQPEAPSEIAAVEADLARR